MAGADVLSTASTLRVQVPPPRLSPRSPPTTLHPLLPGPGTPASPYTPSTPATPLTSFCIRALSLLSRLCSLAPQLLFWGHQASHCRRLSLSPCCGGDSIWEFAARRTWSHQGVPSRLGSMSGCTNPQIIWVLRGPGAEGFSLASLSQAALSRTSCISLDWFMLLLQCSF